MKPSNYARVVVDVPVDAAVVPTTSRHEVALGAPQLPRACYALFKLRSFYSGACTEKHTPASEMISL